MFQFCLKLDDYKAESTYVALHTSAITYSYLLDQKISQTIVEKVKLMFCVQYISSITVRVFHMFGLINNAVSELDYMAWNCKLLSEWIGNEMVVFQFDT